MTTKHYRRLVLLAAAAALLLSPAVAAEVLVLDGATVHSQVGPATVARVVIEDGTIRAVAADAEVPPGARRLDLAGLHIYPGLCDAFGQLGLVEIGAISATVDSAEMGAYNPHLTSMTAIHPASELIPVARANGITHALSAPRSGRDGVIAGQAILMHLEGWTVEEMTMMPAAAMVLTWPRIATRTFDFSTFSLRESPFNEAKEKAEEAQNELLDWLDAARHYRQAEGHGRTERNLKLESLAKALDGGMRWIILADAERDIRAAIEFAEEQGLEMVLGGGRDAWKVKDLLAEKEIPVILGRVQTLPTEEDDPYDRPFRNAIELQEAGVLFTFGSGIGGFGPGGSHSARTLPYEAAMSVAYGLPAEAAIRALTLNPARIFGMEDRMGSIEPGKVANLIVTDGSPLEITTRMHRVLIGGREVSLDNRHDNLYQRYDARPRQAE